MDVDNVIAEPLASFISYVKSKVNIPSINNVHISY